MIYVVVILITFVLLTLIINVGAIFYGIVRIGLNLFNECYFSSCTQRVVFTDVSM